MAELELATLVAGGLGAAATGLFGWLKGKAAAQQAACDACAVSVKSDTFQLQVLANCVSQNQEHLTSALERIDRMSAKISAQSAEIDALKSRASSQDRERDNLSVDLKNARIEISVLSGHVSILQQQVIALGLQPAPPPIKT